MITTNTHYTFILNRSPLGVTPIILGINNALNLVLKVFHFIIFLIVYVSNVMM